MIDTSVKPFSHPESIFHSIRYENISFDVDDYTNSAFADFTQPPSQIQGGSNTVDDVVFNLGAVYKVSPEVSLFTNLKVLVFALN